MTRKETTLGQIKDQRQLTLTKKSNATVYTKQRRQLDGIVITADKSGRSYIYSANRICFEIIPQGKITRVVL